MSRKWLIAIPIIIVLLVLCALMVAIVFMTIPRLTTINGVHLSLRRGNAQAEATEAQSFPLANPDELTTLVVENPCGGVVITGDGGAEIRLSAHKQAWGYDKAAAEAMLAGIKLKVNQDGNLLTAGIQDGEKICEPLTGEPPSIDFTIQVPRHTLAQVNTHLGEISLSGIDSGAATSPHELASDFGSITVRQVGGGLSLKTRNGEATVQELQAGKQALSLVTSFGDIHLEGAVAATLAVNSENGSVRLENVQIIGESKIQSNFGNLTWTGGKSQSLDIESKNGALNLGQLDIAGAVTAKSDFGEIVLEEVKAGSYSVTTLNGKIELHGAKGKVLAKSDFGGISVLEGEQVDFDLTSKNGAILFQGSLGSGSQKAASDFGEIRLQLPPEAAFDFDLQTTFGAISSAFEVKITGAPNSTHWVGSVNGGGSQITASTKNGNISLETK
jgi:DUF4097 and DUF4098 domain-containing protein YvlB